jgi:hypothetical protein
MNGVPDHKPAAPRARPFFENRALVEGFFHAGEEALLGIFVISG